MFCPHCKKEVATRKNGTPINRKASRVGKRVIRYQRYECLECFRNIQGSDIPAVIPSTISPQ